MKTTAPSRASIRQVAARANVSPKTVTNVMRDRAIVAPETRARVLEVVREMNYIPVRSAMQNHHVETKVLGFLCDYEITQKYGVNERLVNALTMTACAQGYDLLMHLRRAPDWSGVDQLANLLDRRTDGVIVAGLNQDTRELDILAQNGISAVVCFNNRGPEGMAWVVLDNASAMQQAVGHLVERGHTRIAHLAGPPRHSENAPRRLGFSRAMYKFKLAGFHDCILDPPVDDWQALPEPETIRELVERRITGVVCFNDIQALKVWELAAAKGLRIPQDLSIIGLDNDLRGEVAGLTSITNPFDEIGRMAVASLLQLIEGADPADCCHTLRPELIERASVGSPAG